MDSNSVNVGFIGQIVNFIQNILADAQNSPNPAVYYAAAAIAVIFLVYTIERMFRIAALILLVGVVLFGVSASQNNGGKGLVANIEGYFAKMLTEVSTGVASGGIKTSNANPSASAAPSTNNPPSTSGSYITGNAPAAAANSAGSSSSASATSPSLSGLLSILAGGK